MSSDGSRETATPPGAPSRRTRTRPTRDETRARLLAGAAEAFTERGVSGASIEQICTAAGFSRGAFYSNFSSKDELVIELLEFSLDENTSDLETYLDSVDDIERFLLALDSGERERSGLLTGNPELFMELILHAQRNPETRAALAEFQRRSFADARALLERIVEAEGQEVPGGIDLAVSLIMAFDLGLSLQTLIDPESQRPGQYGQTLAVLHRLWTRTD